MRRKDRASEKQLQWEERKAVPSFKKRRQDSSKKGRNVKKTNNHSGTRRQSAGRRGGAYGQKRTGKRDKSGRGKQNKRTRRK